jgi:hypothetical protein
MGGEGGGGQGGVGSLYQVMLPVEDDAARYHAQQPGTNITLLWPTGITHPEGHLSRLLVLVCQGVSESSDMVRIRPLHYTAAAVCIRKRLSSCSLWP